MNPLWKTAWFCLSDVAWIFWIGGITFYIAIVVPVGGDVLGPDAQGDVTQVVTWYMNLSGIIALLAKAIPSSTLPRRNTLLALTLLLALQFCLVWLRQELILHRLDPSTSHFSEWEFYPLHRLYLWITTLQWLGAVLLTAYALFRRHHPHQANPVSS